MAFPGAEGSGRYATGGRGGDVYEVTNLNNSGAGSIVDAVSSGNRTIVFRVAGTIDLGGVILRPKSNTTIAGQTAPGDGICLKGRIYIGDVSDVVIRYLRIRVDEGAANSSGDAVDIARGQNIIIDHVSGSYARDETISCQNGSNHITVQWCILSEALTFESHSYGSLIRGEYGEEKTYHHNLYAHNNGRNPRPGNYTSSSSDPEGLHFDFRNNVVYNWRGGHPGYNADTSSVSRYNFIGNVFIKGAESSWTAAFKEDSTVAYGYWSGNAYGVTYGAVSVPADQWSLVTFNGFDSTEIADYKARSYLVPMEPVTTTSAMQALSDVLDGAGASFPVRDIIDARIVSDVINGTGHSIASTDDQPEGAWPALNSLPAPTDSDHDGMPDSWETDNGLNPASDADRNDYNLHAEYTNLEVYLSRIIEGDLEAPAAPTGLSATSGEAAVSLDWANNGESDLAGYHVYRSETPGSGYVRQNASLLTDSDYIDDEVNSGTTYYYVVTAVDTSSNESETSDEVSATPQDVTAPTVPANPWAVIENGTVVLDWLDNRETDFGRYLVYRMVEPGGSYELLTPGGLTVSTYTDDTVVSGTTYTYVITAADIHGNESNGSIEISATLSNMAMGMILREWWTGIPGDLVSDLTAAADYPGAPAGSDMLANLEGPTDWDDAYGTRVRGYLHPPTSGDYTFYIAGDSDCELWLSTDGTPDNAVLIASASGTMDPRQWSTSSSPVTLAGGSKYYVEVLHKEDFGGDHISVAWSGPGISQEVIRGQYLSSWFIGLYGDTTADAWVDLTDFPDFVAMWLEADCAASSAWDLNGDCVVDFSEFSELAWNWMADTLPTSIMLQEEATGVCDFDGDVETEHAGYTGSGYINTDNADGNGIDYRVNILSAGTYTFVFRYASTSSRPADLIIDDATVSGISFPDTGAWGTWSTTSSVQVTLTAGIKDIRLEATSEDGLGNIDYMQVDGPHPAAAACP